MPEAKSIWQAALGQLQLLVNTGNYETFLRDAQAISFDGRQFIISAPNPFIREALQTRFEGLLRKALGNVLGDPPDVLVVVGRADVETPPEMLDKPQIVLERSTRAPSLHTGPTYTFDSFVVGEANRLAHAYWLQKLNDLPTRLVFLHFIGDSQMHGPETMASWEAAIEVVHEALGIRGRVPRYVQDAFIDVRPIPPVVA